MDKITQAALILALYQNGILKNKEKLNGSTTNQLNRK